MNRKTTHKKGILYIIGTPIGNMKDISLRALEILKNTIDVLYCENTRFTKKLLTHYEIQLSARVYTEHNEEKKIPEIIRLLDNGKNVGLVSNAGMPVISDPGFVLVRELRNRDYVVDVIPGPTALITGLVLSAMPPDRFYFGGFLPDKRGKRKKALLELKDLNVTLLFYLSPYKVRKTLEDVYETLGNRQVCLLRELTKMFQEIRTFYLEEYLQTDNQDKWKGELVLVIEKSG